MIGQQIYPLHPSVGDTIEKVEKLDYSLFPQDQNDGFQMATIQFKGENFHLVIQTLDQETGLEIETTRVISQEEIIEAQKNIEKINAFYRLMAEEKKKEKTERLEKHKQSLPIRLEGKMSEQMKKQARMNIRLKEDARIQREFEMGLRPSKEINIQFK